MTLDDLFEAEVIVRVREGEMLVDVHSLSS